MLLPLTAPPMTSATPRPTVVAACHQRPIRDGPRAALLLGGGSGGAGGVSGAPSIPWRCVTASGWGLLWGVKSPYFTSCLVRASLVLARAVVLSCGGNLASPPHLVASASPPNKSLLLFFWLGQPLVCVLGGAGEQP